MVISKGLRINNKLNAMYFHSIQSWDTFTLLEGACSHSHAIPPPLFLPSNQRIPLTKICSRKHLRCEPWLPQAENGQGKKIFKVRKKSGNFTSSQGKFKSLKEVKEK